MRHCCPNLRTLCCIGACRPLRCGLHPPRTVHPGLADQAAWIKGLKTAWVDSGNRAGEQPITVLTTSVWLNASKAMLRTCPCAVSSSAINVLLPEVSTLHVRELAQLLDKLFRRCTSIYKRRYYFFSKLFGVRVPPHALSFFPHGLTVSKAGDTGIAVVDGFCTPDEAQAVIDLARERLEPSMVLQNGKFVLATGRQSDTALVFGPGNPDPALLSFACRAAALTGMPYTHLEAVYVTRYQEGGHYNEHVDYGDNYSVDRLYTVLLYLNDMSSRSRRRHGISAIKNPGSTEAGKGGQLDQFKS